MRTRDSLIVTVAVLGYSLLVSCTRSERPLTTLAPEDDGPPTIDEHVPMPPEAYVVVHGGVQGAEGSLGFPGVITGGGVPPDPHLAVGEERVVIVTNGRIVIFTKQGDRLFEETPSAFFDDVDLPGTGHPYDPEVVYDETSRRFFMLYGYGNTDGADDGHILLAVSMDETPTLDTWHRYAFDVSADAGDLFDSGNLGLDATNVYVDAATSGGPLMWAMPKQDLLDGRQIEPRIVASVARSFPPLTHDAPAVYWLTTGILGCSHPELEPTLNLFSLQDALTDPLIQSTTITLPLGSGYCPVDDLEACGGNTLRTFEGFRLRSKYRNGSLWVTAHINANAVVRWFEFAIHGWPDSGDEPTLVQWGEIDPQPGIGGIRTGWPSIAADDYGNAAIAYTVSSVSDCPGMAISHRYRSDPPGEMRVVFERAGEVPVGGRWGDYSEINVDPVDGRTFWAHHMASRPQGSRATWVQSFTPVFCTGDVTFDGVVNFNDLVTVLASWGPCPPDGACPDTDGDGMVGFGDLLSVLAAHGCHAPNCCDG